MGWSGMPFSRISILAPRGGSDLQRLNGIRWMIISILAPRGGSDGKSSIPVEILANFNPRSPRGERHNFVRRGVYSDGFQSSLPAGGAT